LPAASISETLFTKFFQGAARRAGITDISVLLLGFDTIALQSEKNLWDLSEWAKQNNTLSVYLKSNPAAKIAEDFKSSILPAEVSQEVWMEWKSRINAYFKEFGCTAYEFDFAYATPQEMLTPTFESIKAFLEEKGENPYSRQITFEKRRKLAEKEILQQIGGHRKKLFLKLLHWAQNTAPMRENAIYLMGMGHPLIRRMLQEISERLLTGGAISHLDDIYWLTKTELENCIWEYGKDIYSFCKSLTLNLQEADDLYQDTFLKAMERIDEIDCEKNPKSYLLSIALRLWKNKKRKYAWRSRIANMLSLTDDLDLDDAEDPIFSPENEILKNEEADLVRQAVNRLPDKLKIVILLFYMEDLSAAQIASILKIPIGTVKSRMHHAKKILEQELEVVLDEKHG
jgi:RNA polymerase sigma factor (sigma-70 family)